MAANEITKKLLIYHTLYRLNVSFSNVIKHCQMLRDKGIFGARQLKLFQGYAKELQAEINEGALGALYDKEFRDWHHFGKVRLKEEKRLKGPDHIKSDSKLRKNRKKVLKIKR